MHRIIGIFAIIALIILLIAGIAFFSENSTNVSLSYYFGSSELSLSFVMLLALVVGVVLGIVANSVVFLKQRREISKLKKSVASANGELSHLRTVIAAKE